MRPDWPKYFMNIAEVVATRSEDPKTRVGSVLVKNNRIVSTGYNGAAILLIFIFLMLVCAIIGYKENK